MAIPPELTIARRACLEREQVRELTRRALRLK